MRNIPKRVRIPIGTKIYSDVGISTTIEETIVEVYPYLPTPLDTNAWYNNKLLNSIDKINTSYVLLQRVYYI